MWTQANYIRRLTVALMALAMIATPVLQPIAAADHCGSATGCCCADPPGSPDDPVSLANGPCGCQVDQTPAPVETTPQIGLLPVDQEPTAALCERDHERESLVRTDEARVTGIDHIPDRSPPLFICHCSFLI